MPARQLNVSVRTLQRAFAATGESVAAYIANGGWKKPTSRSPPRPDG